MASYALPNLLVHATATSAFSRDPNYGTPEEKNIQAAEVSLIHATLILVLVLNSQSEIFSLSLDVYWRRCIRSSDGVSGFAESVRNDPFPKGKGRHHNMVAALNVGEQSVTNYGVH